MDTTNTINFQDIIKKSVLKMDQFASISIIDTIIGLVLSGLIGLFIYYIYKKTFRGVVYTHTFNITLVAMAMLTCLIIMTISTNIVLSLGMVGALSIVRFRTAIKDPLDIVFMFWSISVGIATGAGVYPVSVLGSLVVAAVIVVLSKRQMKDVAYLLIINYYDQANDGVKYQLNKLKYVLKSKTVHKEMVELIVEVKIKGDNTAFVQDISEVEGVKNVSLVSYDGDYAP
ncbi:DUF4956 domain-containing protein [Brevibacillus sp. BC25]|jgi:Domain of unknown function (DUF4956)|uniref:DUF4956 domain-containing protein n=1 Tax=Brevibacillus sp. BC25 TaxID=1144308 RepID=UPI000270FBB0|nr:DUF4956 domain-containing protein [Brevibacillus sp. BC25]EJL31337.1 hypothetical protein PMI05_00698 [Brevibacillus sp. BC25]